MPGDNPAPRRRLGELLVEEAILDAATVERALRKQAETPRRRLGQLLIEAGALDQTWLTAALAMQAGMDTVDPLAVAVDPATLWRVPPDVAERVGAFVARDEEGPLLVAQDPSDGRTLRSLAALAGLPDIRVAVGLPERVGAAITRHYDTSLARARRVRGLVGEQRPATTSATSQRLDARQMLARLERGGPRAQQDFATAVLVYAVETGAERLVFDAGAVTATHDGVDSLLLTLPPVHASAVATRLRALLQLDPGATRAAGGAAHLTLGERALEVSTRSQPGSAGGRLELGLPLVEPPDAGMYARTATAWAQVLDAPGLVLALHDPTGLAPALPAPDHVERRTLTDWHAVDSAVRAAQAGKTVLGTLAASSVAEGLHRLAALAPSRTAAAAVLRAAVLLRRIRKVCSTCALPPESDPARAEALGVVPFAAPRPGPGCPECGYRRHRGSFWSHELVVVGARLREALGHDATLEELGAGAVPVADRTLAVDAVAHAIAGQTSAEELVRALPPLPAWAARAPEDRHRGLFRAVTSPDPEPHPAEAADPGDAGVPLVLLVHPGEGAAQALRAGLQGRAEVAAAWSVAAARTPTHTSVPLVGVLAQWAPGGWDTELLAEWNALGTRIVLMGPPGDLARMTEAFDLGADDYVGSVEELAVRLRRLLPVAPAARMRVSC